VQGGADEAHGQKGTPMLDVKAQAPLLLFNPGSAAYGASGNSGPISTSQASRLFLSAVVSAATGTTPSLTVSLDQQDAAGDWITGIASLTALTGPGQAFTSIGPGLAVAQLVSGLVRVVWTITGTTPSFTAAVSLLGR
jgi:hypothetical protein